MALCSGAGGLELGLSLALGDAYHCVCHVERDGYAAAVLVARMEDKTLDQAPIWNDLKTFDGKPWRGGVDIVTAGYPCQPFSLAGKRRGEADERHLWPDIARIVGEVGPGVAFLENVSAHISLGLDRVLGDLADLGYDATWDTFRASDLGAPHRRERVFILAHARRQCVNEGQHVVIAQCEAPPVIGEVGEGMAHATGSGHEARRGQRTPKDYQTHARVGGRGGSVAHAKGQRSEQTAERRQQGQPGVVLRGETMAHAKDPDGRAEPEIQGRDRAGLAGGGAVGDTNQQGLERRSDDKNQGWARSTDGRGYELPAWPPGPAERDQWAEVLARWPALEPAVRRMADGTSNRMDRLRLCGNGVVPIVEAHAFRTLAARLNDG